MVKRILTHPDPVLVKKSCEIEKITPQILELARDMVETMYENQGIGLAAPQVGECVRLITVDVTGPENREGLITIVNPKIISTDGEVESDEGCLSVSNFRSVVKRAARVRVSGMDLEGNELSLEAEDLLAICLQHEIDHLEGVLFIDRISRLKRTLYEKRLAKWNKKKNLSASSS
ncbi:MAG: peptide deformylase [Desulfovibrionales bacterium]